MYVCTTYIVYQYYLYVSYSFWNKSLLNNKHLFDQTYSKISYIVKYF